MTDTEKGRLVQLLTIAMKNLEYDARRVYADNQVVVPLKTVKHAINALNQAIDALSSGEPALSNFREFLYECRCDESIPCYGKGECQAVNGECGLTTNFEYSKYVKE